MSRSSRTDIPALLKCHHHLYAPKPPYPYNTVTLGDSLRRRRLDLGLTLTNVGQELNVTEATLRNWETNRRTVSLRFRQRVHDFIGVCPCDVSLSIGGRLKERREYSGTTRKALAEMFNVDEHTVSAWEDHNQPPTPTNVEKIVQFLKTLSLGKARIFSIVDKGYLLRQPLFFIKPTR